MSVLHIASIMNPDKGPNPRRHHHDPLQHFHFGRGTMLHPPPWLNDREDQSRLRPTIGSGTLQTRYNLSLLSYGLDGSASHNAKPVWLGRPTLILPKVSRARAANSLVVVLLVAFP